MIKRVIAIILAFSLQLLSTTYYVDATSGNDANSGTSWSTAWQTLMKAESAAANGDTVRLRGTFVENDASLNCFYTQKGIVWIGHDSPIVRSVSTSYVLVAYSSNSAKFEGIIFDGEGTTTTVAYMNSTAQNKSFSGCEFKNPGTSGYLIRGVSGTANISFDGCTFTDNGNVLRVFSLSDVVNVTIKNSTATLTGTGGFITNNWASSTFNTVTISGNTITTSGMSTSNLLHFAGSATATANQRLIISGNTIDVTSSVANANVINIYDYPYVYISENEITSIASTNANQLINVYSTGVTMDSVTIKNNTLKSTSTSGQILIVGRDAASAGDNMIKASVTGNYVYGPYYFDNTVTLAGVHGIEYGYQKAGDVAYNYVDGCGYGIVIKGSSQDWSSTSGVYYNVIKDCGATTSGSGIRVKGVKNLALYNNTIRFTSSVPTSSFGLIHVTDGDDALDDATGTIIKNNILYSENGTGMIYVDNDGSTISVSDYNCFYGKDSWTYLGVTYTTLAGWQGAGFDANSINKDPKLRDVNDFRLNKNSPCVNAGTDVGLDKDFLGKKVPFRGKPDIGAFELQGRPRGWSKWNAYQKFY